ncbi:MAG: hypothetical protein HC913_17040 [Microscillaceae bacterium]|nr:hypothetical protein [Microscillaceae bacterium]
MKKDIDFPTVEGVFMAVAREPQSKQPGDYEWYVYLINQNDFALENILVSSKGYGETTIAQEDGSMARQAQKTSVLRHRLASLGPKSVAKIERISPEVLGLCNEFWLSYYHREQLFDKKFVFVPESIIEQNCRPIAALQLEGILHG